MNITGMCAGKQTVLKASLASVLRETGQTSALLVHPGADSQTLDGIQGLGELRACPGRGPSVSFNLDHLPYPLS